MGSQRVGHDWATSLPLGHHRALGTVLCAIQSVLIKWKVKVELAQLCPTDSLWPHGQYSPWNSPGQNTGVDSRSLLYRIFPTQVSYIACGFFTSWATREAQEYWSGTPILSPGDVPDPGIEPWSPALQVASLPTELLGSPPPPTPVLISFLFYI